MADSTAGGGQVPPPLVSEFHSVSRLLVYKRVLFIFAIMHGIADTLPSASLLLNF